MNAQVSALRAPGVLYNATLLGSRLRGKAAIADDYLRDARRLVGLSTVCEPASQLLVSALLLLATSTSGGLAEDGEASRHATIAHGLAGLVPGMRTEIRVGVNVVRYLHTSAAHGAGWPPLRAAAGVSLADVQIGAQWLTFECIPEYA